MHNINMDFSSICRTCLGTKYLNPIFKEGNDHNSFPATVLITTGIKVEINDRLPQQMCKTCIKFIKDAFKFRQLCKDTEIQLINIKNAQESSGNELKKIKIQKPNRRKKSKDIKNDATLTNVKIEEFQNNDDIPLLQQKLNFANLTVSIHKNVKMETEFVKIDDHEHMKDCASVKNENVDKNKQTHSKYSDDNKNDENEHEFEIEFVNNGSVYQNGQDIHHQLDNIEKIDENEININSTFEGIKTDFEVLEESKYETEFLDLVFDSDTDEHSTKHTEIPKYNKEIPNYNMEFPEYSLEIPDKTEFSEYNLMYPKYGIEISKYCSENSKFYSDTIKNRKHKTKKDFKIKRKEARTITHRDLKINENSQNDTENFNSLQIDSESILFIVQDTNRVTCKLCQKDLSKRSIYAHMAKSHPGADSRKVKCELCDTYVLKTRFKRHKVAIHGQDCFRCGYCKSEYDSKEALIEHLVICTDKKRKRQVVTNKRKELIVECDVCNKSMQKASLRLHKEIKHAGMGPVCEHCGRRFGNKFRLSEHLRAKHGYEKFKCSMCDFLSASNMALRNHERRHRGEKPYVCEQCGAKFHATHLLAQHKQSHRTEKNMKCDQCPAAFKANNTLHMHKMTCHNTNTYQCPMCPRTYSARHYAVKHLRSVHRHTGAVGSLLVGSKEPHMIDQKSPT